MTSSKWHTIFGPPGTGKTTFGMTFIEEQLAKGVDPGRIGYIAFTRKAANEARNRAQFRFQLTDDDLTYFRTIHSLCFMLLGLNPDGMMQQQHWIEVGELLGIETSGMGRLNDEAYSLSMPIGDRLFFLENLARITRTSLPEVYERSVDDDVSYDQLVLVAKALIDYKQQRQLLDFTDLLEAWLRQGHVPSLDALFVDEAQDLSKIQWEVVHKIGQQVPLKYAAGDDDQAIYHWAGAAVDEFINLPGEKTVLSHSYRIPQAVHTVATDLLRNINIRHKKEFTHNGQAGDVTYHYSAEDLDLSHGEWLLLARNAYLLRDYERICEQNGYPYESPSRKPLQSSAFQAIKDWIRLENGETLYGKQVKNIRRFQTPWEVTFLVDDERLYSMPELPLTPGPWFDNLNKMSPILREYFLAAWRNNEILSSTRIRINTIHGVKGGEAEYVAVMMDMAARSYRHMQLFPDEEYRVFYVAITRAKRELHIIQPNSRLFFEI